MGRIDTEEPTHHEAAIDNLTAPTIFAHDCIDVYVADGVATLTFAVRQRVGDGVQDHVHVNLRVAMPVRAVAHIAERLERERAHNAVALAPDLPLIVN